MEVQNSGIEILFTLLFPCAGLIQNLITINFTKCNLVALKIWSTKRLLMQIIWIWFTYHLKHMKTCLISFCGSCLDWGMLKQRRADSELSGWRPSYFPRSHNDLQVPA